MSDRATQAYRGGSARESSLVVHYWCIPSWTALGALVVLGALFAWGISGQTRDTAVRSGPLAVVLLGMIGASRFPLVRIRARLEGGHLVVSGRRWPGAETLWSCPLAEASGFEEQIIVSAEAAGRTRKGPQHRMLVLRTHEDQLLGLTHVAYAAVRGPHGRVVARLNGWLAAQKANT